MANKPEQDIAQLETLLRQLEKDYDQFLSGQLRRAPDVLENSVLALVRTYASRPIQNSTLAFKYASLVARYNSFKTVWSRRLREKEEGRSSTGAAAAVRAAPPPRPEAHLPSFGAANPKEYLAADPQHEQRRLQSFFETYRRLREENGESVEKLRPESFQRAIAEKIEKIKREQGCEAVLVRLVAEGGKTRLVAKPFRRGPGKGEGRP